MCVWKGLYPLVNAIKSLCLKVSFPQPYKGPNVYLQYKLTLSEGQVRLALTRFGVREYAIRHPTPPTPPREHTRLTSVSLSLFPFLGLVFPPLTKRHSALSPHTNSDSVAAAQALGKDGIVEGKIKTTKGNTMLNLDNGGERGNANRTW